MRYLRGLVCATAMVLATAAFAEGEESAVDETGSKIEELLNSKLAERVKAYLQQGVLENEQLTKYVDSDYWNAIKDDFSGKIETIISEDEFMQDVRPNR